MAKHLNYDYFPLAIASGQAFCNRIDEIERISNCIAYKRPVLLVSPRRYGKTSLALKAINKTKIPYAQIDFFSVMDEEDIERAILKGISQLITRIESAPKRALALAHKLFEGSHVRVAVSKVEFSIEFEQKKEKPTYRVLALLERLERLSEKMKQDIILFLDEFQCISEATSNHAMEAVLRQVAQLTQSIAFIFSGSNRHLLNQLFDDRKRPFYKLCEKITLDRIAESAYEKHLQKAAKKAWNKALSSRSLELILRYTESHPYYINVLCSRLWRGELPLPSTVEVSWQQYINEERSSVASELELLSKNQKKLLTVFARAKNTNEPLGQTFIQQARMSKTSLNQALKFLEQRDYIYRDQAGFVSILDPLIKSVLSE